MKTGFAFCIVIVAFTSAQGASLRKSWFDLLPSIQETENRVGDVWSDCSKLRSYIMLLRTRTVFKTQKGYRYPTTEEMVLATLLVYNARSVS